MSNSLSRGPSRLLVGLMAASCGLIVANIYYSQPLVGLIGPQLHMSGRAEGLIVSLTQLGYAAGMIFLVPLGDLMENRALVVATVSATIPALILAGLAWTPGMMLTVSALIGLSSVAVQMLIPLTAHLTPEARRGRVVGTVTGGLLFGILLSRPVASVITAYASWRLVFFLSAAVMAGLALLLSRALPRREPEAKEHYGALLASLFALPLRFPVLRERIVYQAACFAGFSLFWTGAPLFLMHRFGFTQRGIAVFALAGALGACLAPVAGHLADRGHTRVASFWALMAVLAAFGIAALGGWRHSVVLLALAGIILDGGVQTSLVLGQRSIYVLTPELRSRMNGVFMASFFLGGAAGSAFTGPLLIHAGWGGVCAAGALMPLLGLSYFAAAGRK
ncbi:MFS transporter [Acidocella sp.]|uniref:MFS transporter n=1 Tax=Acidocella sp. TaxID=50710 RepID=UPI00262AC368|nr:MFS transporter [Acidocella sp.]